MDTIGNADRNDYDRNGNMTVRNKGVGWYQLMTWDSHNRLAQMSGAGVSEGYVYDENGQRLRKSNLLPPNNHTSYFFPGYEETSGGVATRHYAFNGVAVAVRTGGGAPSFLYGDGVNSTVYTTDGNGTVTSARGLSIAARQCTRDRETA